MDQLRVTGTTTEQQVTDDLMNRGIMRFEGAITAAEATGEHVWVAVVTYVLSDEEARLLSEDRGDEVHLTTEKYAMTQFACIVCEQPMERSLIGTRCPGDPEE